MDFKEARRVFNWSIEKTRKWNEYNSKFTDDEVVFVGAKTKANNITYCLMAMSVFVAGPICMLINNFILKISEETFSNMSYMNILFFGVTEILVLLLIINIILKIVFKIRGIKNYFFREHLFYIGINKLKNDFHKKGVKKHRQMIQKNYENSRKNKKAS